MKTSTTKTEKRTDQQIRLVDGEFTPSEALDIIGALLDQKINFHKLQRLTIWEGNVHGNCSFPNGRIAELEEEKKIAKEFLHQAINNGTMIKIKGNLEIEMIR